MLTYEPVTRLELLRHHGERFGTRCLMDAILFGWAQRGATDLGIYNRRRVAGSRSWSLHAVGRALDVGVPDVQVGAEIMMRCVANADRLGVCEVIFNRQRWTPGTGVQPYGGRDPHRSHVHIGQTRSAAATEGTRNDVVRWFLVALAGA